MSVEAQGLYSWRFQIWEKWRKQTAINKIHINVSQLSLMWYIDQYLHLYDNEGRWYCSQSRNELERYKSSTNRIFRLPGIPMSSRSSRIRWLCYTICWGCVPQVFLKFSRFCPYLQRSLFQTEALSITLYGNSQCAVFLERRPRGKKYC